MLGLSQRRMMAASLECATDPEAGIASQGMLGPITRRISRSIFPAAIALLAVSTIATTAHGAERRAPASACPTLEDCLRLAGTAVKCEGHCGISQADEALARTMWEIGPRAVPGLVALLEAPSEQVGDRAGYILASMPGLDATYLPALMDAQRRGVDWMSHAIARVGTPEAMRFLVDDLQHHPEPHGATAGALVSRSSESIPFLLDAFTCADDCDSRFFRAVGQIFREIGKPSAVAVSPLVAIAADESLPLRLRLGAVYVLGRIGRPAAAAGPFLRTLVSNGGTIGSDAAAMLRATAEDALYRIGDAAAVPSLIEAVRAASDYHRALAVRSIASLGANGIAAGPFVRDLLTDIDWDVRVEAAEALGRIGYREAAPDLIAATKSADWRLVYQASWALGALGAGEAIPQLIRIRDTHWYPPVRERASKVLATLQAGRAEKSDDPENTLLSWSVFRELSSQTAPCKSGEVFWQNQWQEPSRTSGRISQLKAGSGTFVGNDRGEWMGELYFLDRAGRRQKLLDDNIFGLFQTTNGPVAVGGLAHMGINRGQVYALTALSPDYWQASMLVTLPGKPHRFSLTPDGNLIMAGGSWAVLLRDGGRLEWLPCR